MVFSHLFEKTVVFMVETSAQAQRYQSRLLVKKTTSVRLPLIRRQEMIN